jgi:GNAT superfamily N-acetyltransferase
MGGPNEELAGLVQEFRNALSELNQSGSPCSAEEARDEAAGYFGPATTVVGLFEQESLIGFSVVRMEEGIYWLSWIYVRPESRGFVNATALFDFSEKLALRAGEDRLYIMVHPDNNRMLRFLRKKGYDALNLVEVTKRKPGRAQEVRILDNVLFY